MNYSCPDTFLKLSFLLCLCSTVTDGFTNIQKCRLVIVTNFQMFISEMVLLNYGAVLLKEYSTSEPALVPLVFCLL